MGSIILTRRGDKREKKADNGPNGLEESEWEGESESESESEGPIRAGPLRATHFALRFPSWDYASMRSRTVLPSRLPRISEAARSGWGIMPKTLRFLLVMPAILFREPLGLAEATIFPSASQ